MIVLLASLLDGFLKGVVLEVYDYYVASERFSVVKGTALAETDRSTDLVGCVVAEEGLPYVGGDCDEVIVFHALFPSEFVEILIALHFFGYFIVLPDLSRGGSDVIVDLAGVSPAKLLVFFGFILLLADELVISNIILPILEPFSAEEEDQFMLLHGSKLSSPIGK